MNSKPFFSIALPTYNRSKDLAIAIQFILNQTFDDFEIVISDNCSTDNTAKIVSSFKDKRIKYFRNKKLIDVMPNVQKVISLCRGTYIFLQGDDDVLFEKTAFSCIYSIIKNTKAGFIRVNYLSISPDKRHVFDFRASKGYRQDSSIARGEKHMKIIRFLLKSDPSFLAGIVFKNELPKTVRVLDSQLYSWFPILFYATQKWGGYYYHTPLILAGWSKWRVREDNFHSLYSLKNGKLTSEKFFEFVETKISKQEYKKFLSAQLKKIYVERFLAIKLNVGNKNLNELADRLRVLFPQLGRNTSFRLSLFLARLAPRLILTHIRLLYLRIYVMRQSMDTTHNLKEILGNHNEI